jgi:hypothetical protein
MTSRALVRTQRTTSALPRPCPWYWGATSTSHTVALNAPSEVARARPTSLTASAGAPACEERGGCLQVSFHGGRDTPPSARKHTFLRRPPVQPGVHTQGGHQVAVLQRSCHLGQRAAGPANRGAEGLQLVHVHRLVHAEHHPRQPAARLVPGLQQAHTAMGVCAAAVTRPSRRGCWARSCVARGDSLATRAPGSAVGHTATERWWSAVCRRVLVSVAPMHAPTWAFSYHSHCSAHTVSTQRRRLLGDQTAWRPTRSCGCAWLPERQRGKRVHP